MGKKRKPLHMLPIRDSFHIERCIHTESKGMKKVIHENANEQTKKRKIVNSNKDSIYKEKAMSNKISNIIGSNREKIIDEIVNRNK